MRKNIVLIGMPCCGKTTIGGMLAEKTGKKLMDTDEEIVRTAGMPVPEIFRLHGEPYFRDLETRIVREVSEVNDGRIIATGGGAVLREENVTALKRTGVLIFLDRSLEHLAPADDRPLSNDPEKLSRMYTARRPVYLAAADYCVPADGSPKAVLDAVLACLEKEACRPCGL